MTFDYPTEIPADTNRRAAKPPENQNAWLIVFLVGFLLGATVVASRYGIREVHPYLFVTIRVMVSSIAYGLIFSTSKTTSFPTQLKLWLVAGFLGVLTAVIPSITVPLSLEYQSSGVTSLLATLTPAVTVLLAAFLLHDEPLGWEKITGVLIAFSGAGLLLMKGETGLAQLGRADWRGYALMLGCVFSNAFSFIFMRRYLKNYDPIQVAGVATFSATLVMSLMTYLTIGFKVEQVGIITILALIFCSLGGTFAAQLLRLWIANHYNASMTSQTEYVVPVIAVSLGALVLGEQITITMLTGMVLIFCGIWLMNRKIVSRRNQPIF